jgi:hypothetical protein
VIEIVEYPGEGRYIFAIDTNGVDPIDKILQYGVMKILGGLEDDKLAMYMPTKSYHQEQIEKWHFRSRIIQRLQLYGLVLVRIR